MKKLLRRVRQTIHNATAPGRAAAGQTARERLRLATLPRYEETTTDLPGFPFKVPDGASFLASWKEIFEQDIYNFPQDNDAPRILDCGANVGVSCLYFRTRFPNARITAFEPDPKIFAYLKGNLTRAGYSDIELIPKGVWSSVATLSFQSEGSDSGHIGEGGGANTILIPTVRLRDFLMEPVDLLKMDIEGAETEVITDIAPCLHNVKNIFVEYHSFIGQRQTLGELIQALTNAEFRVQIHPVNPSEHPFIKTNSYMGMDMQLNIFAIRRVSSN